MRIRFENIQYVTVSSVYYDIQYVTVSSVYYDIQYVTVSSVYYDIKYTTLFYVFNKQWWPWDFITTIYVTGLSQWPCGPRRRSMAACLLRLWVCIPAGAWMSVCCECRVLPCRGLCDTLITRQEESYRMWCVVCDLESSRMKRPWPAEPQEKKKINKYRIFR